MDRSDIRTEVRDIIGELVADFWTDAELNRYIQEALYRFAAESRWPFYITEGTDTLSAADPDLALQDGINVNRHLAITLTVSGQTRSYQPIKVEPAKGFQLRSMFPTTTQRTFPDYFYVTRVNTDPSNDEGIPTWVVKFVPTPVLDMDVEYQYYRAPAELDADADIPELPVEYHKALVHYAAGPAWLKELNGAEKPSGQFGLYRRGVDQAQAEWQSQADDTPLVVGRDLPTTSGVSSA